ncbi:MAG: hypothetical protein PHC69_07680 [Ruminiclostridium sp.]|nr:hypothetical protein [Ruminiclostridium sp.]
MYNPEQKQIILKNSFGVSYHVFYESGRGLCLRMLSDSYVWSRGFVLASQAVDDFSVTLDKDDFFHFVFQSTDGSIMYGHGRHGQIEIKPILSSKDTTPWQKHVSLLISGDTVLVFYKIRYSGRHLISMQSIKNNVISKPIAIDYTDGSSSSYIVLLDNDERCHLFYTTSGSSKTHLIYRQMKDDCSIFNAPKTIYSSDGDILFPSAISDSENQIHLLFQVHLDTTYEILYKNVSSVKSIQTLYKSLTPSGYTGLIYKSGTLYSYRVSGSEMMLRLSRDGGKSWLDEHPMQFKSGGQLTCFSYSTNLKKERKNFYSSEVPGDFSHGYRLALLNDEMPEVADTPIHKNTTTTVTDNLQPNKYTARDREKLHPNVENYENKTDDPFTKKIENRILQLQNITENMQRDLTKQWLLFRDFEKKLDKISSSYRDYPKNYQNDNEFESESERELDPAPELERKTKKQKSEIEFGYASKPDYEPDFENESKHGSEYEPKYKSEYKSEYELRADYGFEPEYESETDYEFESANESGNDYEFESANESGNDYGFESEYESGTDYESEI